MAIPSKSEPGVGALINDAHTCVTIGRNHENFDQTKPRQNAVGKKRDMCIE